MKHKLAVTCYIATAINEWIRVARRNEIQIEQMSLKKEAENATIKIEVAVSFYEGSVIIGEESYTEWKEAWKKLKKILTDGQKRNKQLSLEKNELQNETLVQYSEEKCGWLKCNTDPRKTSPIFTSQEQIVNTRAWKKVRELVERNKFRLCGEHRETVHSLLPRYKKLVGKE